MHVYQLRIKLKLILFVLLISILTVKNAYAWSWGDIASDIVKGVVVSLIVDAVTESSTSAKELTNDRPQTDKYSNMKNIALNHFLTDSRCNVDAVMSFYGNTIYYEDREVDRLHIRKTKEAVCAKYSMDSHSSIKNNNIVVSDFSEDPAIKLIDYVVDFDVYNIQKKKRIKGTTDVRLAIKNNKIIGEFHKKRFSNSEKYRMIVFAPTSNVRDKPNGKVLCKISEVKQITTYGKIDDWFFTDACGAVGVIHTSQVRSILRN